ncbi:hypothetical protein GQ54DRAFT_129909 [Martensiomyces pterosporus]|nr:hypothetical protein GQ54DRAFT_129909 [Martensiomyces pterosporus]
MCSHSSPQRLYCYQPSFSLPLPLARTLLLLLLLHGSPYFSPLAPLLQAAALLLPLLCVRASRLQLAGFTWSSRIHVGWRMCAHEPSCSAAAAAAQAPIQEKKKASNICHRLCFFSAAATAHTSVFSPVRRSASSTATEATTMLIIDTYRWRDGCSGPS